MLQIIVHGIESWNERTEQFVTKGEDVLLCLEHSLVSISKWESKYNTPFYKIDDKTTEQLMFYVKCMTLNEESISDDIYNRLTSDNIKTISDYIESPQTATVLYTRNKSNSHDIITSEYIYCFMTEFRIPFECQYWHINRLITLIRICDARQAPQQQRSENELRDMYSKLNAERKAKLNTKG